MDVSEIVFDTYVICPICKKVMRTLAGTHLKRIHGFRDMKEFKLAFGIPMHEGLVARDLWADMQQRGLKRAQWFRENAVPIGVEMAKEKHDLVPKEFRVHSGLIRRGKSWILEYTKEMKSIGWLDLHDAADHLGIAYNYARKCATDGRLQIIVSKGIRFTKQEWVEDARKLLQGNREKHSRKP